MTTLIRAELPDGAGPVDCAPFRHEDRWLCAYTVRDYRGEPVDTAGLQPPRELRDRVVGVAVCDDGLWWVVEP